VSPLDRAILAERSAAVHRHLDRVAQRLPALADRLVRAAGFRNLVAHAYDTLDMARVYRAASDGPADLKAFLAAITARLTATP